MAEKRRRPFKAANGQSREPGFTQVNGVQSNNRRKDVGMSEDDLRAGMKKLARRQVQRSMAGTNHSKTVDQPVRSKVDESRTVVVNGEGFGDVSMSDGLREPIEISTDDDDVSPTSESESDDAVDEEDTAGNDIERRSASDHEMVDADREIQPVDGADAEPTFGDLVAAANLRPVDVEAAFEDQQEQSTSLTAAPISRSIQIPSATSLGTVLTQALHTNDANLLESCLHLSDILVIRSTIQRLDSSLATALLTKLAEKLHSRPNRAGRLMIWIQWTLVSHGGYLAGQPELMRKLGALHQVLRERASGLQPLLALKGKLDMLEAQMELRKSLKGISNGAEPRGEEDEEGEDDLVIYVEGQDEIDTEDDQEAGSVVDMIDVSQDEDDDDVEDGAEDEDMPIVNGVIAESEESSDENESEDEDLVDDEAEETDGDTGEEAQDDDEEEDGDEADDLGESDSFIQDRREEITTEIPSDRPKKRRRTLT
ncbi:MAG: Small subunit (SSU) processome component [Peltula sp. TS41687]|nr:MAG: Small subunit (SSU) processome component [Peltula sp. TS41687]